MFFSGHNRSAIGADVSYGSLCVCQRNIEVIDASALFAPLEEGMPIDVFQRYLAPAQTQSPEEVRGADAGTCEHAGGQSWRESVWIT